MKKSKLAKNLKEEKIKGLILAQDHIRHTRIIEKDEKICELLEFSERHVHHIIEIIDASYEDSPNEKT